MTELIEAVARGLREKCAEIDNRPGVISPDTMWFSEEYAQAALTAITDAGYRIVKDEAVAHGSIMENGKRVIRPLYAAPGDEK